MFLCAEPEEQGGTGHHQRLPWELVFSLESVEEKGWEMDEKHNEGVALKQSASCSEVQQHAGQATTQWKH